jgi:hypothetical protein
LVHDLPASGQRDVTVLDLSATALELARRRLVDLLGEVSVTETRREVHATPAGTARPFTRVAGRLMA